MIRRVLYNLFLAVEQLVYLVLAIYGICPISNIIILYDSYSTVMQIITVWKYNMQYQFDPPMQSTILLVY